MATNVLDRLPPLLMRLPERPWLLAVAGAVLGLLLFVLVWLAGRGDPAPNTPVPPTAAAQAFDPLPAPMAPGDAATSMPVPSGDAAQLIEEEEAPVEAPPLDVPVAPVPELPSPVVETPEAASAVQSPTLLPDQPQPRYPAAALRNGDTGTVVLRVDVDALGHPVGVGVSTRSGSRALDRAAVDAVSRWQFAPARDAAGNAVPGTLTIPVDFSTR